MSLYSMRMTGNNVLLSPVKPALQSVGGILFPTGSSQSTKTYVVLSVGPGRTVRKKGKLDVLIPIDVKVGDHVLSEMYLGHKGMVEDGHGRVVCDADQLIAVVNHASYEMV